MWCHNGINSIVEWYIAFSSWWNRLISSLIFCKRSICCGPIFSSSYRIYYILSCCISVSISACVFIFWLVDWLSCHNVRIFVKIWGKLISFIGTLILILYHIIWRSLISFCFKFGYWSICRVDWRIIFKSWINWSFVFITGIYSFSNLILILDWRLIFISWSICLIFIRGGRLNIVCLRNTGLILYNWIILCFSLICCCSVYSFIFRLLIGRNTWLIFHNLRILWFSLISCYSVNILLLICCRNISLILYSLSIFRFSLIGGSSVNSFIFRLFICCSCNNVSSWRNNFCFFNKILFCCALVW